MMMTTLDHVVALVTKALMRMAALSRIGTVPGLIASIPLTVLLTGHCLAVAGMTKKAYSGRFMSYILVRRVYRTGVTEHRADVEPRHCTVNWSILYVSVTLEYFFDFFPARCKCDCGEYDAI